ncbi:ATP-binding protein [Dactylosporangium aurantiacum]|uniref:ATP-binding protein n=1 Tax=Dactylosporangium aurantiacum TaxID=35754 RepID=A0A9Q9IL84_9ACTN|nr:ATP-binding protein [Dactylosporangium aurantiacum]MDG6100497.1 ATP-binding protein [Dactylosporangium aurantiacum]UWZ55399.1 ATP-binding protein [Dactylosporangium aurantiacum]
MENVTIAAERAENLEAAPINDPLFSGVGHSADPGSRLTPAANKRARISVISFVGLRGKKQQGFVSQLQMALFSWVKRNPTGDHPLGGLLVMDEAQTLAPSGAMTVCTRMPASHAREHGLGLISATQEPKGLHSHISGNAATRSLGLLSVPVHIEATREMARFKGGDVPDISRLSAGQYYVALEGEPFRKVRTPLCLSHHPQPAVHRRRDQPRPTSRAVIRGDSDGSYDGRTADAERDATNSLLTRHRETPCLNEGRPLPQGQSGPAGQDRQIHPGNVGRERCSSGRLSHVQQCDGGDGVRQSAQPQKVAGDELVRRFRYTDTDTEPATGQLFATSDRATIQNLIVDRNFSAHRAPLPLLDR